MTKIYVSGPMGWLDKAQSLRDHLQKDGHVVTSHWMDLGRAETSDDKITVAYQNFVDIDEAEHIVLLTGYEGPGSWSGGRHVEWGYAYAKGKALSIIGSKEGVFQYLPFVQQFKNVEEYRAFLKGLEFKWPLIPQYPHPLTKKD